jgi:hypothetical protein
MTTVTIKQPAPGEELVRLLNSGRSDELNIDGVSYKPDKRGAVFVPKKHVTRELLTIGSFYPAPISLQESLQDIATHIGLMAKGRERDVLKAALVSLFEPGSE